MKGILRRRARVARLYRSPVSNYEGKEIPVQTGRSIMPRGGGSIFAHPLIDILWLIQVSSFSRLQSYPIHFSAAPAGPNRSCRVPVRKKYCYFDPTAGEGGGVYFWPDRAAAEKWHRADHRRMVAKGSEPRVRILDALMHVGPAEAKQL
jgi:hypothetical protein